MEDQKQISRRKFLAYLGTSAATIATASSGLGLVLGPASTAKAAERFFDRQSSPLTSPFKPIQPTDRDELAVSPSFKTDSLAAFGDKINHHGDTFGNGSAFSCYFPIEHSNVHGLLYVSHERPTGLDGGNQSTGYSASQVQQLLYNQGGSILEIYRDAQGQWKLEADSVLARRIHGLEAMELSGPAKGTASVRTAGIVQGTIANRSAALTPWGTVLSGEGSYDETCSNAGLNPTHYGWIIEVDPFDPKSKIKKHTGLGRFRHGGITMTLSNDNRLVVYMGDQTNDACIYKFVSQNTYQPAKGKANSDLFNEGTLYAADLENGTWIELSAKAVRKVLKDHGYQPPDALHRSKESLLELFQEDGDVYVYAYEAALILGATRTDRQSDLQLHPVTGELYITIGRNSLHGNIHGYAAVLTEQNNDAEAGSFQYDIFASGGPAQGFSSPGSIAFEPGGSLWLASEIEAGRLNQGTVASLKNNGLYLLSTVDHTDHTAIPFASAPKGARFVGPHLSSDLRTMFVSLQYNESASGKPALIAITGIV